MAIGVLRLHLLELEKVEHYKIAVFMLFIGPWVVSQFYRAVH